MPVGSMFSGIGGIDIAFHQAGFQIAWANEIDAKACETFRNYDLFNNVILYENDIRDLNPANVPQVDIITSGFPCQAFSIAGYRKGFNDERGNLFFETARFIEHIQPRAYLLENVKNLENHDKGKTLQIIKETLVNELGYSFIPFVLNAKDYGNIPQNRDRIYIVGFANEAHVDENDQNALTNQFMIPEKIELTHTIHDYIDNRQVDACYYYNEQTPFFEELQREINDTDTVYQWRRKYVRKNKNNLCPTLTANMGTGGHNVPIILDNFGIRKLTPRECLNFQGFPPDFQFPHGMAKSHCYKQAGNSVVIPVLRRIAENLAQVLNHNAVPV